MWQGRVLTLADPVIFLLPARLPQGAGLSEVPIKWKGAWKFTASFPYNPAPMPWEKWKPTQREFEGNGSFLKFKTKIHFKKIFIPDPGCRTDQHSANRTPSFGTLETIPEDTQLKLHGLAWNKKENS